MSEQNNAVLTGLAALQATVAGLARDVQDLKSSLGSYVRADMHEQGMREVLNRVQANEMRAATFVTTDTFQSRARQVDEQMGEITDALKKAPDVRRQNFGLWLSLAALALSFLCGLIYVATDLVTLLQHLTLK